MVEDRIYVDRGNDPFAMMAAMNGGMNGMNNWFNNPFIYLIFLMMFGRNGLWGNEGNCANVQLETIQEQMNNNQNTNLIIDGIKGNAAAINQLAQNLNCDFNTLNSCCCDLRNAITQVGGQVGFSAEKVINAVNMGDCNVINAIKDCCCNTQKAILEMGYQNQLANCQQTNTIMTGINGVNTGLERGFSNIAYETQKQTCDIINAGNANTQRIIDTMNNHWKDEQALQIQDLKFQLSQERQNRYLAGVVSGNNCGCGCGYNSCTGIGF